MNTEEKIYNKIKNASHNGDKNFPGMEKVWNRVEEKLNNTLVEQNKNTWQKLAIAATVLLSFSILYQFVFKTESLNNLKNSNTNSIIVSNDSVKKIIEKAKEIVVENNTTKHVKPQNTNFTLENKLIETQTPNAETEPQIAQEISVMQMPNKDKELDVENKIENLKSNSFKISDDSFSNSAYNSSNSNAGFLAPSKKYEVLEISEKKRNQNEYEIDKNRIEKNKDLVVIDGVAMGKNKNAEKELNKISANEIAETTYLSNPLYIINGIEYTEASLFGDNPTSPYAPLNIQKITATTILKPAEATKIYGKKGENGIVIITTKKGKPAKK